jgi:tetratricopeptide (TPR) repeat protein
MGRRKESYLAFEKALECDPLNTGAMVNAARPYCELKQHDRAAELLCTALRIAPTKQTLTFNAGNLMVLMMNDRAFAAAERVARSLVAADARHAQAWHNLGVLLSAKGQREEALRCVRTAVKCEPNNLDGLAFLARLCGESGLYEEALALLDRLTASARREDKGSLVSWATCLKAQVLAGAGRRREAVEFLEAYLKVESRDDGAWFILCGLAEAQGDLKKALDAASACDRILRQRGGSANVENARWARSKIHDLRMRLTS